VSSELGAWCQTRSLIEPGVGPHLRLQVVPVLRTRPRPEPTGDWPVSGSGTTPIICQRVSPSRSDTTDLDSGGVPTVFWGSQAARGQESVCH
jgi:hypothetical protein